MRLTITILLTCFLTVLHAQDDDKNMVGFGCYFQGTETPPVKKVRNLIQTNRFNDISNLLTKGKNSEKYLAVITLERLDAMGQYNMTDRERTAITEIKKSDKMVSICSGCTYFDKVSLRTMFSEANFIGNQFWLDKLLKKD
jgi:hypothetical protein